MSCYIGKLYLKLRTDPDESRKIILYLTMITCSLWTLFLAIVNIILPSRPLANLTYVIWGLANGSLHYLILSIFDYLFPEQFRFIIYAEMVSEYRLSTFILANLISTSIRRIFNTKSISIIYTLKVVYTYLFLVCFVVSVFFYRNHMKKLAFVK